MEVDVVVLGGGPGGYTAAIRAAQLGAKVACIEKEPELGGTCLRVGCIPTKAWVQTAHFLHQGNDTFAKLGVKVDSATLDFGAANEWKAGVVKQMTTGVAGLFKANGVEWVKGYGRFKDANTIAVEGGEDISFKTAVIATGSFPLRPPIPGLESDLCVDSTGLLAQTEVPKRLVILELVGGDNLRKNLERLDLKGRIAVIGVGAGATAEVNFHLLMRARGRIHGSMLRNRTRAEKADVIRRLREDVLPLLEEGRVVVPVDATYPLDQAQEAYDAFAAGGKFGKIVIVP